ncbi:NLRC3 [Symbiodinium sp. CCMP2592]|nr:NLRC3 [Symbiodinium sp. CCMP2592]
MSKIRMSTIRRALYRLLLANRALWSLLPSNDLRRGDAGAKTLAAAVSSVTKMEEVSLNLEMCDLGAEGAGALASSIGMLEKMQKLSLNLKGNKLCPGPRSFPAFFSFRFGRARRAMSTCPKGLFVT